MYIGITSLRNTTIGKLNVSPIYWTKALFILISKMNRQEFLDILEDKNLLFEQGSDMMKIEFMVD